MGELYRLFLRIFKKLTLTVSYDTAFRKSTANSVRYGTANIKKGNLAVVDRGQGLRCVLVEGTLGIGSL